MFIYPMWIIPQIPTNCDLPPTLYAILNSIVNFDAEDKTKIEDLASAGRTTVFNFNYPLSNKVNKAEFEEMILNHFLMRRLGYETYTAWHIALKTKLNEIMPIYNKMFDALEGWELFKDGEMITRTTNTTNSDNTTASNEITTNTNSNSNGVNTSDQRFSDTPQNEISDVKNGKYVTNYTYNEDNISDTNTTNTTTTGTNESESNGNRNETEVITRSPYDKMNLYKQYIESVRSIYSMIFRDLDCLFYQLV